MYHCVCALVPVHVARHKKYFKRYCKNEVDVQNKKSVWTKKFGDVDKGESVDILGWF